MIWIGLVVIVLCAVVYFGIEPYKQYKLMKKERLYMEVAKIKMQKDKKKAQEDLDVIQRNVEKFAEEQRQINLTKKNAREEVNSLLQENRRKNQVLKQSLSKKDYQAHIQSTSYARGGKGNPIILSWEHEWREEE